MCRIYGLRANAATAVECCLVHAPNSLLAQSRRDLNGFDNADGWGIAAYDGAAGAAPRVARRPQPAHGGRRFREAARTVTAPTVVAHVRRATVGVRAVENTHPFVFGPWAMVHNGTVPEFERVRPLMLEAMAPGHRAAIRGVTDSEHLFHMILSAHEAEPGRPLLEVLGECLGRVAAWACATVPHPRLGLNVLLTDGARMVGSRWMRTLYAVRRGSDGGAAYCPGCGGPHARDAPAGGYRALAVASEPISGDEPWREVPERSVYEVTAEFELRVEPL
ncbi:MAG TPA: class II glutamine amidotransferase [Geminicoccaceae bacterium]|nr:class II glutamine amidotransferase [Geminicoccaceae bacterium]